MVVVTINSGVLTNEFGFAIPGCLSRVTVTLASGKKREADLVIGADGINSKTAHYVLGT